MTEQGIIQITMDREQLEAVVLASFIGEINAFKPGNVSIYADGHDMTADDFIMSAEAVTPVLCEPGACVGQRVLDGVKLTHEITGCNTNLGMLLLFAPLIVAAEFGFTTEKQLHNRLQETLNGLTMQDAKMVFEAIRLASPGGLGKVDEHDVSKLPDCSLQEAMEKASARDFVALQYYNAYQEIFNQGLSCIKCFVKRWNSVKWATVSCYLMYISSWKDSHISRKFGDAVAERIKIKSKRIADKFNVVSDPESCNDMLRDYDRELKTENYNPGTSADMTAASLLVYNLTKGL